MAVPGQDPVPLSPVPPLSARPMPQAIAERAHGGLSRVGLNYNQGIEHAKAAHCHSSYCRNSCNVSYPASHSDDVCWRWPDNGICISIIEKPTEPVHIQNPFIFDRFNIDII